MKYYLLSATISFTLLSGCIIDDVDEIYTLAYSFSVGNKWEYESISIIDSVADTTIISTEITSKDTLPSGNILYEFKDSSFVLMDVSYSYYELKPDGVYLYASQPGGHYILYKQAALKPGVQLRQPPLLLIPFKFKNGDQWVNEWTYDTIQDINSKAVLLKHKFIGEVTVSTKQGDFNCYKFETTGYFNEKRYHYYDPSAGLIMKEIIESLSVSYIDSVTGLIQNRSVQTIQKDILIYSNI